MLYKRIEEYLMFYNHSRYEIKNIKSLRVVLNTINYDNRNDYKTCVYACL